jgi:hypothetical protein
MIGESLREKAVKLVNDLHKEATTDESAFLQKYEHFKPVIILLLEIIRFFVPDGVKAAIDVILKVLY